jgi:signal transduction histidine kinase
MEDTNRLREEVRRLGAEREALQARAEESARRVAELNVELTETNQGVVVLYAELDDKARALREASELKSRFLSYMSHEFRTPLGSIRSISRILLDRMDGPLTDEQARQVRFIDHAAVELTELINDLLDLARIEAGRIVISPAWFEMIDLFSALRGMFKPILTSQTVSLILEEPAGVPRLFSDDKRLSQILRNFVSNALKFTLEGEVRVSANVEPEGYVAFRVADTGIGIAAEHLGSLFQDFYQIDSPLQRRYRGTGLGLSLSKKLAELLGGWVGVTSEPGRGSTFTVTIPIRYEGSARPDPLQEGGHAD